jgi:beta-lactamase class A
MLKLIKRATDWTTRRLTAVTAVTATLGVAAAALSGCTSDADSSTSAAKTATAVSPAATVTVGASPTVATATTATTTTTATALTAAFNRLESQYKAQLGLYAVDTGTGRTVAFQADQRFAFCSTIKAFAAGGLLRRDSDTELGQTVTYSSSDLVDYSPVTSQHVHGGMTLSAVMTAAIEISDNTALNLMLDRLGGPAGLQNTLRSLGDSTTNVDRTEPTVNSALPGDARDTSTPRAMAGDLRTFVLGDALSPAHRALLTSWLKANTTGGPYIRAAVPAGWQVGDKTGNGDYGTRNDIAVLWPPHGARIVIAVLSHRGSQNASSDDGLIADATKLALRQLTP